MLPQTKCCMPAAQLTHKKQSNVQICGPVRQLGCLSGQCKAVPSNSLVCMTCALSANRQQAPKGEELSSGNSATVTKATWMPADLIHHCLKHPWIEARQCMLVGRGVIGRAAARRQGQLHILYTCILRHVSPMGGHGGSEGLVGVASLLVSQSFLHQNHARSQDMQQGMLG